MSHGIFIEERFAWQRNLFIINRIFTGKLSHIPIPVYKKLTKNWLELETKQNEN